jgi:hypothetical protein
MFRNSATLLWGLAAFLAPASAQIWPAQWQEHTRQKAEPAPAPDALLWAEYGGQASEKAMFSGPVGRFSATAYRMKDSTGALALYQALRPGNAVPVRGAATVSTTPGGQWMAHQNYVLVFQGWRPLEAEMKALYALLPEMRSGGGLPRLLELLPETGRIRNSERFIQGIDSLARYEPRVNPALVGFEDGAEGMTARYLIQGKEVAMLLLEYPTPQLARQRLTAFMAQPGWAVKRSGPLLAVVPEAAGLKLDRLLDAVSWQVHFTWNEPTKYVTAYEVADMILVIFELTGVLLLVCIGGGIVFAGIWFLRRRRRLASGGSDSEAVFLHLD